MNLLARKPSLEKLVATSDVICFQEVRKFDNVVKGVLEQKGWHLSQHLRPDQSDGGVALATRKQHSGVVKLTTPSGLETVAADYCGYRIACVYAPPELRIPTNHWTELFKAHDVVAADFNARHLQWDANTRGTSAAVVRGKELVDAIAPTSSRVVAPKGPTRESSTLDFFVVKEEIMTDDPRSGATTSDHNSVTVTIADDVKDLTAAHTKQQPDRPRWAKSIAWKKVKK